MKIPPSGWQAKPSGPFCLCRIALSLGLNKAGHSVGQEGVSQNKAFRAVWASDAVSSAGSVLTQLAIPIIAATLLNATAFEMGLLAALGQAPRVLFSLYLGAVIGGWPKLKVMRACQLVRALSLASIPAAYGLGVLSLPQLYVVALLNGTLALAFLYADRALLPKIVAQDDLLAANAKIRQTATLAGSAGPGLAGAAMQVIGAPLLIVGDAVSYIVSWAFLRRVQMVEDAPPRRPSVASVIGRGARFIRQEQTLLVLTTSSLFATAGAAGFAALQILYFLQTLSFTPFGIGLVLSAAGGASMLAALVAERVSRRLGARAVIILSTAAPVLAYGLICAAPSAVAGLVVVAAAQGLIGLATPLYQVNELTLRQTLVPEDLLPMVTAFRTFLAGGIAPLAALAAGALGHSIGLREALGVATAIFALGVLPLFFLPKAAADTKT